MAAAANEQMDRFDGESGAGAPERAQNFLALAQMVGGASKSALPPVHSWDPPSCGDIGLEILRDGAWRHQGDPIPRESLVKLFASLLRRDPDGQHWVVTPVEKAPVKVACTPFIAVALQVEHRGTPEQTVACVTQLGDLVVVGAETPLRVEIDPVTSEPLPLVTVRHGPVNGLEARVTRACFFDLVELAHTRGSDAIVRSQGVDFALGSVDDTTP